MFTQPSIRAQIKVNIKAPRHWPLCGEFTGDRWISRTNGQLRGKCFHLMTSSWDHSLWGCSTGMYNNVPSRVSSADTLTLKRLGHFLAATKQLYEWYFLSVCPSVCPSVCLSVCPSVRLSHLFDYVPIIVSSWNFQELSYWTRVRSMQKVKVRGQRSRSQRSRPKFSFPDCNSSLNSHMMIKLYI